MSNELLRQPWQQLKKANPFAPRATWIKLQSQERDVTNFSYFDFVPRRITFCIHPHTMSGMKMSFDSAWFAGRQPKAWIVCLGILLTVSALNTGCSKATNPAPVPTADSTNSTPTASAAPVPVQTPQPVVISSTNSQPNLQTLNRALMAWMIKNHRHPQSFDEFASSAPIQIPNPPPGKKYTLNTRGFIILADNTTQ